MTKQVLLSISGLQFQGDGSEEPVSVITVGDYYNKNGKHYVIYDEILEGYEGRIHNTIKAGHKFLEVTKKGMTNVHMVFEESKKNMTYYDTPFGNLLIGIDAKNIDIVETNDNIDIKVDYSLDINYEFLAECSIVMNIKSKDAKDFSLM